jgi:hypothetical protein
MNLSLNEVQNILQSEIIWHLDHPDKELTKEQQNGFLAGIKHSQTIIRLAEEKIRNTAYDEYPEEALADALRKDIRQISSSRLVLIKALVDIRKYIEWDDKGGVVWNMAQNALTTAVADIPMFACLDKKESDPCEEFEFGDGFSAEDQE